MRLISIAVGLAAAIVLFALMTATRLLSSGPLEEPDIYLRKVQLIEWNPPPPPPPEVQQPKTNVPPPPAAAVPNLAPTTDSDAPTIASTKLPVPMDLGIDHFTELTQVAALPSSQTASTASSVAQTRPQALQTSDYKISELDSKPRLISNPAVRFPRAASRKGIKQIKALVVVKIDPSGKSNLERIISCSHPAGKSAAARIANGSRFSPPKKNGKAVTAIMTWPIIIR